MPRTRTRPLPAGALTLPAALLVAAVLIVLGAALLFAQQAVAAGLGLAAVVLYNGAYTPLKRLTAFAAVPGGVIGTLPPAVGWTVAGGTLQDPRLVTLGFLFFVWQVPHFWLLLLTHGEEYARAGLPTLTHTLGRAALARVTFAWLATAALSAPLLAWCGLTRSPWTAIALVISAGLLLRSASALLRPGAAARAAFGAINVFACAVMVLLVLDATLASGASAPR